MRFARHTLAHNYDDPAATRLVSSSQLNLLQLDYRWPCAWAADAPCLPDGYASGFLLQLHDLRKGLFLDPQIRLMTNAGGTDPWSCAEKAAHVLCKLDCGQMLITAVRGDNVLPRLEELLAEGIELVDIATGTRLEELRRPILAAQVELGAGPLATALAEGSRLVVAGCYDEASPAIAAAVDHFDWSWNNYDALASVATGTLLLDVLSANSLWNSATPPIMRFAADGTFELVADLAEDSLHDTIRHLETAANHSSGVTLDLSSCKLIESSPGTQRITGVTGRKASPDWRIRLLCDAGFIVDALLPIEGDEQTAAQFVQLLRSQLGQKTTGSMTLETNRLTSSTGDSVVQVRGTSLDREPCESLARAIANLAVRRDWLGGEMAGGLPVVRRRTDRLWMKVPREAVEVSVDTRPAIEWR